MTLHKVVATKTAHATENCLSTVVSECICATTRQLSRLLTKVYDDALRPYQITINQFNVLCMLAKESGMCSSAIVTTLDLQKSTFSKSLKVLKTRGMVVMEGHRGSRGRGLYLTERGRALIDAAYPAWLRAQQRIKAMLGYDVKTVLDRLRAEAAQVALG